MFTDEMRLQLVGLEESLWKTETRFDLDYMETVLSADFFEFGRSGRIYQREDTLHGVRPQTIDAQLKNVTVFPITQDVIQVTYVSEVVGETGLEIANRSSIWIKTQEGWKLRFHQGTPVLK